MEREREGGREGERERGRERERENERERGKKLRIANHLAYGEWSKFRK